MCSTLEVRISGTINRERGVTNTRNLCIVVKLTHTRTHQVARARLSLIVLTGRDADAH